MIVLPPVAVSLADCRIGDSVSVLVHHEGEVIVAEHVKRNLDELRLF
jgi:antitoxin component of MazEF toxin-antitoxin module